MSFKLLLKLLLSPGLIILFVGVFISYFFLGNEGGNLGYWSLFVIFLSLATSYDYFRTGKKIGILKEDANYLKTQYNESFESNLNEGELTFKIKNSTQYLGKVWINDSVIEKQRIRALDRMSKSEIEIEKLNGRQVIKLSTKPYSKTTLVDYYVNYKCFNLLKRMIKTDA